MKSTAGALLILGCIASTAAADPMRGERVFQRCYACHSVVTGEDKLPGPNLKTIIGRPAGTVAGFEYSAPMVAAGKAQNVVWTRATLDKFLTDPDDVVPGTMMQLPVPLSPEDRRDVIDYLESAARR
jgi:cytochrome c